MSKKSANKNQAGHRSETLIVILAALLILAAFIAVVIVLANRSETRTAEEDIPEAADETEEDTEDSKELITIPYDIPGFTLLQEAEVGVLDGSNLELLGVGRYTGEYFEDRSDDEVEDVYAIVVRNNGAEWIELATFTMLCGDETATFELSSLPNNSAVLLLESNRMTWREGDHCFNAHVTLTEYPLTRVFNPDEDFKINSSDGVINITNISGRNFENDVLLDYKNFDYGLFLGGLVYRVRFPGIAAGETRQAIDPHYSIERSFILYMSYDD